MIQKYCPNCGKVTGHKRAMGMGTFLGAICTAGVSLAATPFYPKRCVVCGCTSEGKREINPQTGKYKELFKEEKEAKLEALKKKRMENDPISKGISNVPGKTEEIESINLVEIGENIWKNRLFILKNILIILAIGLAITSVIIR